MKKYENVQIKITHYTTQDVITNSYEVNIPDDWYE